MAEQSAVARCVLVRFRLERFMSIEQLNNERRIIDEIDEEIASLLVSRFGVVKRIKYLKRKMNLEIHNSARETEVLEKLRTKEHSEYLLEVFNKIMEESRKLQQKP